ncbi:MAG: hypothetical protein Greene101449_353 [Candidatus Peregrinibacteria bacterium Greene1014_49]|nr:MAG: hypothetical protein Greene101449_353 [Candidatus Peregrinibacteria bacterium Greene1014_49]
MTNTKMPCAPASVYVMMYTMERTVPATQARRQFFKLLAEAGKGAHVKITFEGHPPVILVSEEEFEGLIETLEVMSDPVLMKNIRAGLREKGGTEWSVVKKKLHL